MKKACSEKKLTNKFLNVQFSVIPHLVAKSVVKTKLKCRYLFSSIKPRFLFVGYSIF